MKICPKCGENHEKHGTHCSRKCANSRTWNDADKIKKSMAAKNSEKVKLAAKLPRVLNIEKQKKTWEQKILNASWKDLQTKKRRVLLEQNNCCNKCGLAKWLELPITLELEHKDGNTQNNERDNLEALCPNCHSQTPTWRGRNSNKYKNAIKISEDDFIHALRNTTTIRQALIVLGLAPKGGNYKRAYELKSKMGL